LGIIVYCALTGGRASVIRASVMSIVFLISLMIEREGESMNTLGICAFLLLLLNPHHLFDVGFQLSFVCVSSIILFTPRLIRIFPKRKTRAGKYFLEAFLVSFSIFLGVEILIAYYFGIISPSTLIANLFVIPMMGVIVVLGVGILITSLTFPIFLPMFAICLKLILNTMVAILFLISKIPFAFIHVEQVSIIYVFVYYVVLAGGFLVFRLKS